MVSHVSAPKPRGRLRTILTVFAASLLASLLAACGLPAAAPTPSQLEAPVPAGFDYAIVNLDEHVAAVLGKYQGPQFGARFRGAHYVASDRLRPGDVISITVYETGGSSLFTPPPNTQPMQPTQPSGTTAPISSGMTNIPAQVVEADGTIIVPFAGRLKVVGKTPSETSHLIEEALQGKTVGPQVLVSVTNNAANVATVGGEVNTPRPVLLSLRGERLLDVIAAAGGAKYPAYETYVQIVRGRTIGMALLQSVVNNPIENVVVRPNDQIFLKRNPRTFAVLGATQKVSQYTFDTETVTLAEAIARAGGPIDTVGSPNGIYLFRFEPWFLAKDIVPPGTVSKADAGFPKFVPVLYRLSLDTAPGYFVAQSISIRDKDVILVTNADATQLMKTLAIVRGFTGIAFDLAAAGKNF